MPGWRLSLAAKEEALQPLQVEAVIDVPTIGSTPPLLYERLAA
jgi:hypothetical protein